MGAASATVGNLRIVFSGETGPYKSAVAEIKSSTKSLSDLLKNELEPRQRAVNAAVRDFLGQNEKRRAEEYVQAVAKIGGATKLVEADQRKVNAAINDALGHYTKLGQQAPQAMLDLEKATRNVDGPLKNTNETLGKIWSSLKSAAGLIGVAFTAGAVVAFAKSVFNAASAINDQSKALGFSAEAFQRYSFAAKQSGSSQDTFVTAAAKLNDVLGGDEKSVTKLLERAGLRFSEIQALKPEEAFVKIANAVASMVDPYERANVGQDLFGRAFKELLPGMIEGYDKLSKNVTLMSEETVKRLAAAEDAWESLGQKITIWSGERIATIMQAWSSDNLKMIWLGVTGGLEEAAIAAGKTRKETNELAAAHDRYAQYINKPIKPQKELTEEQKKAASAAKSYREELQRLADQFTGKAVDREVVKLAAAFKLASDNGAITDYQLRQIAKQAENLRDQGAQLTPELLEIVEAFQQEAFYAKAATGVTQGLLKTFHQLGAAAIGAAPKVRTLGVEVGGVTETLKQINNTRVDPDKLVPPKQVQTLWSEYKRMALGALRAVEEGLAASLIGISGRTHQEHKRAAEDAAESFEDTQRRTAEDLDRTQRSAREKYDETARRARESFERTKDDAMVRFKEMEASGDYTAEQLKEAWVTMNRDLKRDAEETDREIEAAHAEMTAEIERTEKELNSELETAHQEMLDAKELASHRWKDNLGEIWEGIKVDFKNILTQMVSDFIEVFIKGTIASLIAGKSQYGAAFAEVFGSAAKAGTTAAATEIATSSAAGEIATASSTGGAWAGSAWASAFTKVAGAIILGWAFYKAFQTFIIGYGDAPRDSPQWEHIPGTPETGPDARFETEHGVIVDQSGAYAGPDPGQALPDGSFPSTGNWGAGMAAGGIVMPRVGGTWKRLAEAGVPEAVVPLDQAGLGFGGPIHIHLEADGRHLAEVIVPNLAQAMQRLRLA